MGFLSKIFGGSSDDQAQPKNESWQVDATVSSDEIENLALSMDTCENCKQGYMCTMHAYQFNAIEDTDIWLEQAFAENYNLNEELFYKFSSTGGYDAL